MSCLTDYIGLKITPTPDPAPAAPKSGLYINILPGVSTELADKIADCEQANYLGVWSDVQIRAYEILKESIVSIMHGRAKINREVYQTKRFATLGQTKVSIPASAEWRGVYVRVPQSKYAQFNVLTLYVYSETIVTTTFRAWDPSDGKQLYTKSIDLVVGLNEIEIENIFGLRFGIIEVFAAVDCTSVQTIETQQPYYIWEDENCNECNSVNYQHTTSPELRPASLPTSGGPLNGEIQKSSQGKGVWIEARIQCSVDEFICQNKALFKTSWLYLLGRELLSEKIASPRLTYWAASNLEVTMENRTTFSNQYKSYLKKACEAITLTGDTVCFDCIASQQVLTGRSFV
jgi:hypothetical protein